MSIQHPLTTPLIKENPLALRVLGVCPALAITNSLTSALIMSAALTVVLIVFFQNEKVRESSNIFPKDEVLALQRMNKEMIDWGVIS